MITFTLNGKPATIDGEPEMPLLWAIRESAGLTGTNFGCGIGELRYRRSGHVI
jgi:isoquinoline 1-oxidoreductase alpha subunit